MFAGAWGNWADFETTITLDLTPGPIELVTWDQSGCGPPNARCRPRSSCRSRSHDPVNRQPTTSRVVVTPVAATDWRSKAALADAFAPGRCAPSVLGSRYLLAATD